MHGRWDHHHAHGHAHEHEHRSNVGHNAGPSEAAQWQTPHLPNGQPPQARDDDAHKDLDLVEKAFVEGFAGASDPTSFLRLAGVPFSGQRADGARLNLLRVEQGQTTDLGSLMPHLGGASFRYDPLPARLTSRRQELAFVYHDGRSVVRLSLSETKTLTPVEREPEP